MKDQSVYGSHQCTAKADSTGQRCRLRSAKGHKCWHHTLRDLNLRVKKSGVPAAGMGLYSGKRPFKKGQRVNYTVLRSSGHAWGACRPTSSWRTRRGSGSRLSRLTSCVTRSRVWRHQRAAGRSRVCRHQHATGWPPLGVPRLARAAAAHDHQLRAKQLVLRVVPFDSSPLKYLTATAGAS